MKKFLWIFVVLFSFCFLGVAGCSKKQLNLSDYLSDCRTCIYAGENESVFSTLCSGMRENPYSYDGVKNDCVDFCIVAIWPKNAKLDVNNVEVEVIVGENNVCVTLERSPYEYAYMADLGSQIVAGQEVRLVCDELGADIDMACQSAGWDIQAEDALRIGGEALAEKYSAYVKGNHLDGECYLKIIYDKTREIKQYYWYFTFVARDGKTSSCVIDTASGKVLAKI